MILKLFVAVALPLVGVSQAKILFYSKEKNTFYFAEIGDDEFLILVFNVPGEYIAVGKQ